MGHDTLKVSVIKACPVVAYLGPSRKTLSKVASPNRDSVIFVTTRRCDPDPKIGMLTFLDVVELMVALSTSLLSTRSSI